ncbi:hypothetical protein [Nocardia sp. NPDC051570]|uniref:hypothetical protein n=1 Tax=Nocardia sp. NPDC051570 TaxID=3364324 RepID=UPI0037940AB0
MTPYLDAVVYTDSVGHLAHHHGGGFADTVATALLRGIVYHVVGEAFRHATVMMCLVGLGVLVVAGVVLVRRTRQRAR